MFPIFKNDCYYDTFQRSLLATIKAQGQDDVAYPDFYPDDGDQYEKQLFLGKSLVYSILLLLLKLTKEENWSRSSKDMQGPFLQSSTITTMSQMLHNMKL